MLVAPLKFFILVISILAVYEASASLHKRKTPKSNYLSQKWETSQKYSSETVSSDVVTVSGLKRISVRQFTYSWGVTFPILYIVANINGSGVVTEILLAANAYSVFLCLPGFYGYFPSFDRNHLPSDISFKLFPFVKLKQISFPEEKYTIPYDRWAMIPSVWACEILMLLSWQMPAMEDETGLLYYSELALFFTFFCSSFHVFGVFQFINRFFATWDNQNEARPELISDNI